MNKTQKPNAKITADEEEKAVSKKIELLFNSRPKGIDFGFVKGIPFLKSSMNRS